MLYIKQIQNANIKKKILQKTKQQAIQTNPNQHSRKKKESEITQREANPES